MSFEDALKELSNQDGYNPRELLLQTMKELDNYKDNEVILLNAPTGYGKTNLSLAIYYALKNNNTTLGNRLIHVLPLRSIGDQLFYNAVCKFYPDKIENLGSSVNDIGLQHQNSLGSPMMAKTFTITTLDSFIMSLYKLPPYEMSKINRYNAHFDVSRGFIFTSIVVFDEAHLYFSDSRMATSFLQAISSLSRMKVPIIIMSATMPNYIIDIISKELSQIGFSLKKIGPIANDAPNKNIKVHIIKNDELFDKIVELHNKGSLFITSNTVKKAYQLYKELKNKGYNPILLHSRFAEKDKINILRKIINKENYNCNSKNNFKNELDKDKILISTQVIEAGLDFSADYGISYSAPPENLIQRMGRIKRYGGNSEFFVVEPDEDDKYVYEENDIKLGFELANENKLSQLYIEDIYNKEKKDPLDGYLEYVLYNFDMNPFIGSKVIWDFLKQNCSFVRKSELIRVIPYDYANCKEHGGNILCDIDDLNKISFSLDRKIFLNIYEKYFKLNKKLLAISYDPDNKKYIAMDSSKLINNAIKYDNCISILMINEDIDGFLLYDYDNEVGYID
jgi:CRISPR-associated endonuclease/helicase Cas3